MGAWGYGPFENDDAADWTADLVEMDDAALIEEAIERVIDAAQDYIEAPDACCALAAAEVVAALRGKPAQDLPEDLRGWLSGKPGPAGDLLTRAKEAVEAIKKDSELRELYEEAESIEEWEPLVIDLSRRLT